MQPNPLNPSCPHCEHSPTRKCRTNKSGTVTYFCPSCDRYHTPNGVVGRPKRTDGLTAQQAWDKANKEARNEAQRKRRAKKKIRKNTG